MECGCITRIEEKLTKRMMAEFPQGEVTSKVEFQNKTMLFKPGRLEMVLGNPVLGKVRIGKKTRKFDTQVMPTYCPFCGKKLREEKAEEGGKE